VGSSSEGAKSRKGKLLFAVSLAGVVLVAVLSSHSRMGLTALLFGVVVWSLLYLRDLSVRENSSRQNLIFIFGMIFFLVLFGFWFGIDEVINRFGQLESGDGRFEVWAVLLDLPTEFWIYGIGVSNFSDIFQLFQPEHFGAKFYYAHNDYLEFALELGLAGFAIMLVVIVIWYMKCRSSSPFTGIQLGAIGTISAMALHSIVDFNLQIPANVIYFAFAVGVLMNGNLNGEEQAPLSKRARKVNQRSSNREERSSKTKTRESKKPIIKVIPN